MKAILLSIIVQFSIVCFSQSVCECEKDLFDKEAVSCDTIRLTNKALLYYQYNCDTIWLTFEKPNGKRKVLFSMGSELGGYNYRLGFQLTKEFQTSLLFRYGCPANGPCEYILTDKSTGQTLKKFHELIFTSEDYPTNVLVYFTDYTFNRIAIFNTISKKIFYQRTPGNRFKYSLRPENQFKSVEIKQGKLMLLYRYPVNDDETNWKSDMIIIDLKKYAS